MDGMEDILRLLPHRPPMLMVDRIIELREDGCTALKNISWSEPCFEGHFPDYPIFPGVLLIEAMAQTCALWLRKDGNDCLPVFAGIESARFLRKVKPGDTLKLSAQFISERKNFYTFHTSAAVEDQVACTAVLTIYCKAAQQG